MMLLTNKRARYEYEILQEYSAGIVLEGGEVKSLRSKHGSLRGSYVRIIDGEAFLVNAQISPYPFADTREYDPKRTRKLLLRKKQIVQLEGYTQQNKTLVPLRFELQRNKIKLVFGVARGLKKHQKREKLKERDQQRQVERELRRW